jgi:hypothetical protein
MSCFPSDQQQRVLDWLISRLSKADAPLRSPFALSELASRAPTLAPKILAARMGPRNISFREWLSQRAINDRIGDAQVFTNELTAREIAAPPLRRF